MKFTKRKGVHVSLYSETHAEFRSILLKKDISMQAVFEEFASQVVSSDPYALKIVEEAKTKKIKGTIKKLSKAETSDIFDLLEQESPIND